MEEHILDIENYIQKSFYYLSKYKTTRIDIRNRGNGSMVYSKDAYNKTKTIHHYGSSNRIFFFNYFGLDINNSLISKNGIYYLQTLLEHKHIDVEMCKSLFVLIKKYFTLLNNRKKYFKGSNYHIISMDSYDSLYNKVVVIYKDNLIFSTITINSSNYNNNLNDQGNFMCALEKTIVNKITNKDKLFKVALLKLNNEFIKLNEAHELLENI